MMAIVLLQSGMRKQYTKIMRLHLCILAGRNGWTGRFYGKRQPTAWDTVGRLFSKDARRCWGAAVRSVTRRIFSPCGGHPNEEVRVLP